MSPEQTLNSDVGPASDIYSLGLVFYEIVTGTVVFRGGDLLSRQKTETPPSPRTISEGVPEEIDRMIMKCIEKAPAKRYQTPSHFWKRCATSSLDCPTRES